MNRQQILPTLLVLGPLCQVASGTGSYSASPDGPKRTGSFWEVRMRQSHLRVALIVAALGFSGIVPNSIFAAGCRDSPVLFAYHGSIFALASGNRPTKIAEGFHSPQDLTWAPGCARYAFTDSGALWVAAPGHAPETTTIPGKADSYVWSPSGKTLGVTTERKVCEQQSDDPGRGNHSDAFLLHLPSGRAQLITTDCRSALLGWSSSGEGVLLRQRPRHQVPCEESTYPCASGNLVIWDKKSKSLRLLTSINELREQRLDDPTFVWWDSESNVIYTWSMAIPIGGDGLLVATQARSGKVLWTRECWDAAALPGKTRHIAIIDRKTEDYDTTGRNWSPWLLVLDLRGKSVRAYPPIPDQDQFSYGFLSRSLSRFAWLGWEDTSDKWSVNFGTRSAAEEWRFVLPPGVGPPYAIWTPTDTLVVETYVDNVGPQGLLQSLWWVDPSSKTARTVFEGMTPLGRVGDKEVQVRDDGSIVWGGHTLAPPTGPLVLGYWSN